MRNTRECEECNYHRITSPFQYQRTAIGTHNHRWNRKFCLVSTKKVKGAWWGDGCWMPSIKYRNNQDIAEPSGPWGLCFRHGGAGCAQQMMSQEAAESDLQKQLKGTQSWPFTETLRGVELDLLRKPWGELSWQKTGSAGWSCCWNCFRVSYFSWKMIGYNQHMTDFSWFL